MAEESPPSVVGRAVEEARAALGEHADVVADLLGRVSAELRTGFAPAVDSFLGFFHVVDWKGALVDQHSNVPCNSASGNHHLKEKRQFPTYLVSFNIFSGVFLAERINTFLGQNWKSFSTQNYFDPQGLFISVIWSGPLLLITILILVNTLVTLCMLIVRWKRAELRHRARQARNKQE
ncbi:hypothetical protein ACP70R_003640 [Stipagrostis hirtigluma subsp. patula]